MTRFLTLLVLGLAVAAPAAAHPCQHEFRCLGPSCRDDEYKALVRLLMNNFVSQGTANLLFLSGGGAKGAWGAGVLDGWRDPAQGAAMPTFDVVTGVSTGAVQSTYAFLGTDEAYELMKEGYTTIERGDVFGFPYPLPWIPHNLNGLRKTLEKKFLKDELIRQVGDLDGERALFVGTVNLDTTQFVSWNMTCIAAAGDFDLYRKVILASSANPIGLKPIKIGGDPHVDGGVRYRIYAETVYQAAGEAAERASRETQVDKRVVYVVNGKLRQKGAKETSTWFHPIVWKRSLDISFREGLFGSLYAIFRVLHATGEEWTYQGTSVPDDLKHPDDQDVELDVPKADEYEPDKMEPLYRAGVLWGQQNDLWHDSIPDVDVDRWACEE